MKNKIKRREFLKTGMLLTSAAITTGLTGKGWLRAEEGEKMDMVVVKSADSFKATQKALDALGGMKKFVPAGSTVGLLINASPWWKKPGSYTHPEIVLATIQACFEAKAKRIHYLVDTAGDYWQRMTLSKENQEWVKQVKPCSNNYIDQNIKKGKTLKKSKIIKELLDCDIFINLPIIKNHAGTHMSGNLKNMMGTNDEASNRFFHAGSGAKGGYDDIPFLSQCIADLNTIRQPNLCILDASEFLLTNGPMGPGELGKAQKVVIGTDPVAVDAYAVNFLGLKSSDILMIKMAAEHGLGRSDTDKMKIKEITI